MRGKCIRVIPHEKRGFLFVQVALAVHRPYSRARNGRFLPTRRLNPNPSGCVNNVRIYLFLINTTHVSAVMIVKISIM